MKTLIFSHFRFLHVANIYLMLNNVILLRFYLPLRVNIYGLLPLYKNTDHTPRQKSKKHYYIVYSCNYINYYYGIHMELLLLSLYSLWRSERIYQLFLDRNLKVLETQMEYSRATLVGISRKL